MDNSRPTQQAFTQEQMDYLSSMHFINKIDDHLRIVSSIDLVGATNQYPLRVILLLEIYYNNHRVDTLNFDLKNYAYEDIIHLVKNIRENEFLLHEVDLFLAGDLAE